ncbi:MAG: ATP-binding cassette domain-containing protein, partial [Rubripirellula sp.]
PSILCGCDLKASAGQFIAVTGRSGSGKSTLLRLILGLESDYDGAIQINGRDLRHLSMPRVRQRIGSVLQESQLLNATLYDNICCGRVIKGDEIESAIAQSGLGSWMDRFPMGLNTMLSDNGKNFSGGQRQQILLARSLVGRPNLLLLDEATSAMDDQTQKAVMDTLATLSMTRIIVAHRLSTLRQADLIYVLDEGLIVQQGTFQQLASRDGLFGSLVEAQARIE